MGTDIIYTVHPGAMLGVVTNSSSEVFVTADGRGIGEVRAAILALWEQWKEDTNPGWKAVAAFEASDFAALEVFDGTERLGSGKTRRRFYIDTAQEGGDYSHSHFVDRASHPQAVFFSFDSDTAPMDFRETVENTLGGVARLFVG